jgi:hypothetical protein
MSRQLVKLVRTDSKGGPDLSKLENEIHLDRGDLDIPGSLVPSDANSNKVSQIVPSSSSCWKERLRVTQFFFSKALTVCGK